MYDVSKEFEAALKQSHQIVTKAEIYSEGVFQGALPVLGGEVTIDRGSSIRRRCSLVLPGTDDLVPRNSDDWLWPMGNEVKLWRGIRLPNGQDELVPLGVFQISNPEISDTGDGLQMTITGYDRARKISRASFLKNYKIHKDTPYLDAVSAILEDRMPDVPINLPDSDTMLETTPNILIEAGADPWEACLTLVGAIGGELFFDAEGEIVIQEEPDMSDIGVQPVWAFIEGQDALNLDINRTLDDEEGYNHFIVMGEGTDNRAPCRGEAMDADPNSPTYYLGPYGDVPYFETSQLVRTNAQAQKAANALLRKAMGIVAKVNFSAVPNPALDVNDLVSITRARSGVEGRFLIQTLTTPLGPESSQAITCRDQKAVEWEDDS